MVLAVTGLTRPRRWWWIAAGLCAAMAAWTTPPFLIVIVLLSAWMALTRRLSLLRSFFLGVAVPSFVAAGVLLCQGAFQPI